MSSIGVDIHRAAKILSQGGLVAIPTETVYGLAANIFHEKAIKSIFRVKNRPSFNPLIIHISEVSQLNKLALNIPEKAMMLAARFWPGPLTLILDKTDKINNQITGGLESAAFRVPDHPLTKALLALIDFPLVAPSANPFMYVSPTTALHVQEQLGNTVDYILDGGPCTIGLESTIVSFKKDKVKILRLGGLNVENIEKNIGKVDIQIKSKTRPNAPGMFTNHYSPKVELKVGNIKELLIENSGRKIGVISFKEEFTLYINSVLAPSGHLPEAAHNLFSALRWMDSQEIEIILAEYVPNYGIGKAINDRLTRASLT